MPQSTLEIANELIAGSFGGAAQVLVGQPLDTVKTRAQIAPSTPLLTHTSMCQTNRLTPFIPYNRGHVCQFHSCFYASISSEPRLAERAHGHSDADGKKRGRSGTLQRFASPRLPRHVSCLSPALPAQGWPVPSLESQVSTLCSLPLTGSRNVSSRLSDSSP